MKSGLKKIGVLLIAVSFSVAQLNAQAPGYMGKKFCVGYGLYAHPAFNSIVLNYGDYPINTLHEFFVEYTTGKKFTLGLSAQLFRYRYNATEDINVYTAGSSGSYNIKDADVKPSGNYLIKGRNYRLYGKFFKDKYLAPWGKYFLLGVALDRYITFYNPEEMNVPVTAQFTSYATGAIVQQEIYVNDFGPTTQIFQKADIFFGNGNSRILGNKIVLDYGYSIGFVAMARVFIDALDYTTPTPENYIEKTATSRSAAINRFNLYLKIGYLF